MFHLPIKLPLLILFFAFAFWKRKSIRKWYVSLPLAVRTTSLILFVIGLIAIEFALRNKGAMPYFTVSTGHGSGLSNIIPLDSLVDNQVFLCDSFGVNKLNANSAFHREPLLNKDGFRSIYEFTPLAIDSIQKTGKQVIFLIGDSYTYGLTADSGQAFANLLEKSGKYAVFNAGIPGTDVPQYKAVINEYIINKQLKPDKIVVCITGNDLDRTCNRKLTPGVPILFYTNAGGIYGFQEEDDTSFNDAKSAYQNILNKYTIIGLLGEGRISNFIGHSVLACRLLDVFRRFEPRPNRWKVDPAFKDIQDIKAIGQQLAIPVELVYLPGSELAQTGNAPNITGVISLNPMAFTKADYTPNMDNHPLNSGHKKIAKALEEILEHK